MIASASPLDGFAEAAGRILAHARRDWQAERELAQAETRRTIAELEAKVATLSLQMHQMLAERLAGLKDGRDGDHGRDADPALIESLVENAVAREVAKIPVPKDGQDADPELVAEIAAKRVSAELTEAIRADVEAIHADVQAIGAGLDEKVAVQVAVAVAELPPPKNGDDGEPGKDADPEVVVAIVAERLQTEVVRMREDTEAELLAMNQAAEFKLDAAIGALPVPRDGKDGLDGDPGPQGERGAHGVNGKDGLPGERGKSGEVGPQGERGVEGPVGLSGERGLDGSNGKDGVPGERGERGEAGAAGSQGERGIDGAPGEAGPAGPQGLLGERGEPGEAIAGPPGERGDPGPSGERGERGVDGLPGERGDAGESVIGPQGEKGETGIPGEPGERGEKGDSGDSIVGPQGERGEMGIPGPPPDDSLVARFIDEAVAGLPPAERGEAGPEGPRGEKGDPGESIKGNPGERGPEGQPGKLPGVKAWQRGVHYEGDVRTYGGATYQALKDTAEEPPHEDWLLIAARGERGSPGKSGRLRGLFDPGEKYSELDLVVYNGSEWRARKDNPGSIPGDGWQLSAKKGDRGASVVGGEINHNGILILRMNDEKAITVGSVRGPPGPVAPTIKEWITKDYQAIPMLDDGTLGPALDLRDFFEQYDAERT